MPLLTSSATYVQLTGILDLSHAFPRLRATHALNKEVKLIGFSAPFLVHGEMVTVTGALNVPNAHALPTLTIETISQAR